MVAAIRLRSALSPDFPRGRHLRHCFSGIVVVFVLVLGSATFAQKGDKLPSGWATFRPDDGSFEVAFPEAPVKESGTEQDYLKKEHDAVTYRVGKIRDQVSYSVTVIEGIDFKTAADREKEFQNMGFVFAPILAAGAEFFDVGPLKFPGAEDAYEYSGMVNSEKKGLGDGILHIYRRAFMKGGRAFLLTYVNRQTVDSSEKTAFVNSFVLLPQKRSATHGTAKSKKVVELQTNLIDYSSNFGGFQVKLPFKPVYSRRTQVDRDGAEHIQHLYLCERKDDASSAVLVSMTEFETLKERSPEQLDEFFNTFVHSMAGQNKVIQFQRVNSEISEDAWDFRYDSQDADSWVLGRIISADDRFYVLQAIGNEAFLDSASTEAIVNSLAVTRSDDK
jgi:hypothetical protein